MESKEKNTKEKILEEALKLFAQSGYMGTSMNDIASKLGVTKAALYKHYKSKQEILDSIIEKMNELDIERVKQYEMPEGDLEKVTAEYKETAFDKIKQFTKVQFLHWTEEEFSSCFRKMLTLEQYREPQMAQLYQNYLASGPLTYMEALFSGMLGDEGKARLAMISSVSCVSRQIGTALTLPNSLNNTHLPSITGIAAYAPILPRPNTALPSETTATVLAFMVYV